MYALKGIFLFSFQLRLEIELNFLPTARSAVGLVITFSTFTPSIGSKVAKVAKVAKRSKLLKV
jgi:hypothetical protein